MEVDTAASWPTLRALPSPATTPVVASGLAAELAYALGGPFHFLLPDAFTANLVAMQDALTQAGVDGFVYYAKKANKAAVFVERAAAGGAGVDVASVAELREALGHGVRGEHLMVTGPAKDPALLRLAVTHSATIAVDALDELDRVISLALTGRVRPARVLLRVLPGTQPHSRFGMNEGELTTALKRCLQAGDAIRMEGFSFHLSGYDLQPRADLAARLVDLCLTARLQGLEAGRISIGGGLPVSYTDAGSWHTFLAAQRPAHYHARKTFRTGDFYPYHSPVSGADALAALLASHPENTDSTLADLIGDAGIELLLEPGRALLDQTGATVFRVQGVKDRDSYRIVTVDGTSLSLSEQWFNSEYLPDPQLIPQDQPAPAPAGVFPASVGAATCLESDMLTWRKIAFPHPPRVGDLLLYPNTAGYQMDSNESPFHDLPLPPKVVIDRIDRPRPRWRLDRHFT
ncbi:type III PLP-dependent enzyme domain-containing protein [Streptomyces nodosus]|uniref:Amino acid decarboxylase n=1 Tax=Streptomyces nodosus TaxID=40318 RepID=A0A0B5D720_9ACTN|nr:amino acid decarboxylase [Streptomyces nodosus]AJE38904.1 amino acid decarboxylase [Streptomyces nodosus]MBB4789715.1 diaminopimelate decarboxylase [Streptomyces nodosus]QEV37487.1 Y4yA family PLP-dependent enzyme [Streptomyces nodosus]